MRIAQLVDSLFWGGAQQMQVTFARVMRTRGVETTVISLDNDKDTPYAQQLREYGARVIELPRAKLFDARRLLRLARLLQREKFQVLHTHLSYANIVGALAARIAGVPVVAGLRSAGVYRGDRYARLKHIEMFVLRFADQRVMANAHAVADAHRARLGGKAIDVIPNAVEPAATLPAAERRALRAELCGEARGPLLLSAGRLMAPKGFADLLRAFARVRQTHPQAMLAIAGDGKLRSQLADQIDELSLNGHARLLGARDDVPALLAAADIYVSSSLWEGLPVAVLEAMAAGLPVVATAVGELPRVLSGDCGLLIPPGDHETLASALRELLDDPQRRRELGAAARRRVSDEYGIERWAESMLALYRSMAA